MSSDQLGQGKWPLQGQKSELGLGRRGESWGRKRKVPAIPGNSMTKASLCSLLASPLWLGDLVLACRTPLTLRTPVQSLTGAQNVSGSGHVTQPLPMGQSSEGRATLEELVLGQAAPRPM